MYRTAVYVVLAWYEDEYDDTYDDVNENVDIDPLALNYARERVRKDERYGRTELESNPNLKYVDDETTESDQTGSDRPESSFSNYSNGRNSSRAGKVSAPQPAYQRSKDQRSNKVSAPQPAYKSRNKNSEISKTKDGDKKAPQRVGKTDEETRHKDKSWLDKRRKDQNKAKLGNHNRKAMSDRKKAAGML